MPNTTVASKEKAQHKLNSLKAVNQMVLEKRNADLLRFRTCCCDPRASK